MNSNSWFLHWYEIWHNYSCRSNAAILVGILALFPCSLLIQHFLILSSFRKVSHNSKRYCSLTSYLCFERLRKNLTGKKLKGSFFSCCQGLACSSSLSLGGWWFITHQGVFFTLLWQGDFPPLTLFYEWAFVWLRSKLLASLMLSELMNLTCLVVINYGLINKGFAISPPAVTIGSVWFNDISIHSD